MNRPVTLGLGSNHGDRLAYLRKAIQLLKTGFPPGKFRVLALSPLYESDALLLPDAPTGWDQPHLNLAVSAECSLEPPELLRIIKGFETQLGRKPRGRWAPREIDIDILAMGSLIFKSDTLVIPHPRMMDRPFAVLPFADLAPGWIHPELGVSEASVPSANSANIAKPAQIVNLMPLGEYAKRWRHSPADKTSLHIRRSHFFLSELVCRAKYHPGLNVRRRLIR